MAITQALICSAIYAGRPIYKALLYILLMIFIKRLTNENNVRVIDLINSLLKRCYGEKSTA